MSNQFYYKLIELWLDQQGYTATQTAIEEALNDRETDTQRAS